MSENENTTYQYSLDAANIVLTEKFTGIQKKDLKSIT